MMNLKKTLLLVVALVAIASSSFAGVSVFGGLMLPQEQFGNVSETGMLVGAELSVPIIPTLVSAGVQGFISRSNFDYSDFSNPLYDDYEDTWYLGEVIGFGKLSFPLSGLHVKAGLGFTRYGIAADSESINMIYESESHMVGVIGAGMKFLLVDLSAQYHIVNWDDRPVAWSDLGDAESFDKSFSYITLTVGMGF
ncbi:MAG: hypothetical protein GY752_10500 [bacterium]|nr:hypothetical protein [bacterium]MCP4798696.1 hypothetical protein [bacterium]